MKKSSSLILPDDSVINILVRGPKTTLTNAAEKSNGSNSEKKTNVHKIHV